MLTRLLEAEFGGELPILVVDDDPDVLDATCQTIAAQGARVLASTSPRQAISILEEVRGGVDVGILDHLLPGMTGRCLARRIRERWPEVAIGLLTGHDDPDLVVCDPVVDGVARKPLDASGLLLFLARLRRTRDFRVSRAGAEPSGRRGEPRSSTV